MAGILSLLLVLGIASCGVYGKPEEPTNSYLSPLARYVTSHSDPDVIPQQKHNVPVKIKSFFAILNIADVNEEHNVIETESTIRIMWDTGITWNPSEYGDAQLITLPKKYFWIPPMQSVTSAVPLEDLSPGKVTLYKNGTALYPGIYRSKILCDVSTIRTGATCNTIISFWGYTKNQLMFDSIGAEPADVVKYFAGSNYQITGSTINFIDLPYDGVVHQLLKFSMTIQEKPDSHHHRCGPFRAFFQWH